VKEWTRSTRAASSRSSTNRRRAGGPGASSFAASFEAQVLKHFRRSPEVRGLPLLLLFSLHGARCAPWVRGALPPHLGCAMPASRLSAQIYADVQRQLFLTDLKAPAKVGQIRKFNNVFSEFFVAIAMDLAGGEDTDTADTLARVRRTLAQAAVEFCAARSASSSVFSAGEIALPAVHGQRVAQLYMYDICM